MKTKSLGLDTMIDIFSQLSNQKEEFTEDDAATTDSGGSGGGTSNVPKWADSYQLKRGPANMLGRQGEKWDTGLTRGPANQIW
jgi:hypothetical protein